MIRRNSTRKLSEQPLTLDLHAGTGAADTLSAHGLRPFKEDFYGVYALTADADMYFLRHYVFRDYDPTTIPQRVVDPVARRDAYIWAALLYEDLAHLMPDRGPDDITCPYCGGSGLLANRTPEDGLGEWPCWCCGLGWLPNGMSLLEFK